MIWDHDTLTDPIMMLSKANDLWTKQAFTAPTKKTAENIRDLCSEARELLEDIIGELEAEIENAA